MEQKAIGEKDSQGKDGKIEEKWEFSCESRTGET